MKNREFVFLEELSEWLNKMPDLQEGQFRYYVEKMKYYHEELMKFSKFKKNQKVKLNITPEISETVRHGWYGHKELLVKGAKATIYEVEHYNGEFRYSLMFNYKGEKRGTFSFEEKYLSEA